MSWLSRLGGLFAGRPVPPRPGDEVWSGGEAWKVTATLVYRVGGQEWPAVKVARGSETTWVSLEPDGPVRYDPLPGVTVSPDGSARWSGRVYTETEVGPALITLAAGDVQASPGDRLTYQTLTSPEDRERWLSVERWEGGPTEVSVARAWPIDRVVRAPREEAR